LQKRKRRKMDKWNELKKWINQEIDKLEQEFDKYADESYLKIAKGMKMVLYKINELDRFE